MNHAAVYSLEFIVNLHLLLLLDSWLITGDKSVLQNWFGIFGVN